MSDWRSSPTAEATLASVESVARAFADAGHELYLVGGVVRDLLLGSAINDLDFTTSARPEQTRALVSPLATALWTQGERFGTIGATVDGRPLEITTFRAESYDEDSRKPIVSFGDDLVTDLSRRDFTINAMAIDATSRELADPYGGAADLDARLLRTPLDPEISFTDDPLRMMRAARFIPRFGLEADDALSGAVVELGHRLEIVSAERVHDEFERLLAVDAPRLGFEFLESTTLLGEVMPELDRMRWPEAVRRGSALDPASDPSPDASSHAAAEAVSDELPVSRRALVRRAALVAAMGDQGEAWLRRLRYSTANRTTTAKVAAAAVDISGGGAADARALRRLAHSVGAETIVDVLDTAAVIGAPDDLVAAARATLDELRAVEDLSDFAPPLDGAEVIELLSLDPGPAVGDAMRRLLEHRIENGPFDAEEARRFLTADQD